MSRLEKSFGPLLRRLIGMPRSLRRGSVMLMDVVALLFAAWAGFSIRLGVTRIDFDAFTILATLALACWLLSALIVRPYRSTTRYTGRQSIFLLLRASLLMMALLSFILLTVRPDNVPRTLGILQPLLFFCFMATGRVMVAALLQPVIEDWDRKGPPKRVLVYGSGNVMQNLALAIGREPGLRLVGIIDETGELGGALIEGAPVWQDSQLEEVLANAEVDELFLAHSGRGQRATQRALLERLRKVDASVHVRVLPSMADVAYDKVSVSDMRQIEISDLLGRDPVDPDPDLIARNIRGRVVMVTGAGGSIGSELCRQILSQEPDTLILVDQSEFQLYAIESELQSLRRQLGTTSRIEPELCDVADPADCKRLFERCTPQTVYHAAAYKHVPILEKNVATGVRNNVAGTLNACLEAERSGTDTFILVSTDKAVRPTSVMGASKRVCELIVQARAEAGSGTRYSAVRFGNVLGSSGSVVPKFREQIERGGPVTVTHMDMTRFFMTIPEAAQLVIQAGAMAEGGEVYLLDMGDPVRISDLARAMIELSGLEVKDEDNPDGDIEIVEVGLRPGEKLYEELLIGDNPLPTQHSRIVKGRESHIAWNELQERLDHLFSDLERGDRQAVRQWLVAAVPEFTPDPQAAPLAKQVAQS